MENAKKANKARTDLLLIIENERNQYLKTCNIKLNNEFPREKMKKYDESYMISFKKKYITHVSNYEVEKICRKEKKMDTMNVKHDSNASCVGNFYYNKCIKEGIGMELIHQRKRNVSYKKLEVRDSNPIVVNRFSLKPIDTELSFIEAIHHINSTKNQKSAKSNNNGNIFVLNFNKIHIKKNAEDFLQDKEQKQKKLIKHNFKKLQNLVKKMKKEVAESSEDQIINSEEEVFEILEYKGIKFHEKKEEKVREVRPFELFNLNEEAKDVKIKSIIHPKKISEVPINPFAMGFAKSERKDVKSKSNRTSNKYGESPNFQKKLKLDFYDMETNANTNMNTSPSRPFKKAEDSRDVRDENSCEKNIIFSNNNSIISNDNSKSRVSTISNHKCSDIGYYSNNRSINFLEGNLNHYGSAISKYTDGEGSKYTNSMTRSISLSAMSKPSNITRSSISDASYCSNSDNDN